MNKSRVAGVLGGVSLMIGLTACSGVTTEADEVAIRYEGSGVLEPRVNPTFMECVPPSKGDYGDMGDGVYTYPFGGQTLKFSDRAEEAPNFPALEVSAPSPDSGGQALVMKAPLTIFYTPAWANPDGTVNCEILRDFHERIGRKYDAWTPGGWQAAMSRYLRDPVDLAVDRGALGFNWIGLTSNEADKIAWEGAVKLALQGGVDPKDGRQITGLIEQAGGGGFFRIDSVLIQRPDLPDNIKRAISDTEAARQGKLTAAQFQEAAATFPGGPTEYQKFLDSQAIRDAIAKGLVQVLPVPYGSNVNTGAVPR